MIEGTMAKTNMKAARLVKEEREKRGWTQAHLATVAGVSDRTIQRFERDGTAGKETLMAIASVLDLDVSKLTEEELPKVPKETLQSFPLIVSGKEALDIVIGADSFDFDYTHATGEVGQAIAAFLEFLRDAGEIGNDVEIGTHIQWAESVDSLLWDLTNRSYLVFGKLKSVLLSGPGRDSINFNMATLYVVKNNQPGIYKDGDNYFLRVLVPTKRDVTF